MHCSDIICILVGVLQQFAVTTMVTLVLFETHRCNGKRSQIYYIVLANAEMLGILNCIIACS